MLQSLDDLDQVLSTTLYKDIKLVLTSPSSGGRSVVIIRTRPQATEFSLVLLGAWKSKMQNLYISE
jgi:hypothetical protein